MEAAFKAGDRVRVPFGHGKTPAIITEDRGEIGFKGRRLYRVLMPLESADAMSFEVPESEIELLGTPQSLIDHSAVVDYFIHGGLVEILRSNVGGRTQPRVWLRPLANGRVIHTFQEVGGSIGGATVPFQTLFGDRIFLPKKDEVISFLQSFLLDIRQVKNVIQAVGTAP